jgi:hypothetical protein
MSTLVPRCQMSSCQHIRCKYCPLEARPDPNEGAWKRPRKKGRVGYLYNPSEALLPALGTSPQADSTGPLQLDLEPHSPRDPSAIFCGSAAFPYPTIDLEAYPYPCTFSPSSLQFANNGPDIQLSELPCPPTSQGLPTWFPSRTTPPFHCFGLLSNWSDA